MGGGRFFKKLSYLVPLMHNLVVLNNLEIFGPIFMKKTVVV